MSSFLSRAADHHLIIARIEENMNDLHGKVMNLNPEKRKQNLAIDEALKKHKDMHSIMVAIYARAFRDAKRAAVELVSEHESTCTCKDE